MKSRCVWTALYPIILIASIIELLFNTILIFVIDYERTCHTVFNLLSCNTALMFGLCLVSSLITSSYGLRADWADNQPACQFCAYASVGCCTLLLYSHVTHAVSRLSSVVFFHHQRLLSERAYWLLIVINWHLGLLLPLTPLFMHGDYVYEEECRLCTAMAKTLSTSVDGIMRVGELIL